MSSLADRVISALRADHDALSAHIADLSAADLARTSGSSEWDVAQVLSNLGSGAENTLAVLAAATIGDDAPGQDAAQAVWDRWNGMDDAAKAAAFGPANERLVTALEALDDGTRETLRIQWFLPSPVDLDLFAGMRLGEALHHTWDVRVALDPAVTLEASGVEALLDTVTGPASFLVGWQGKADRWSGPPVTLRVQTTDPARTFGLTIGDAVSLGSAPEAADGVLAGPAEAVLRLFTGRLGTPSGLEVSGPASLDDLRAVFPGY